MGKHQRQQIVTSSPESSAPKKENIEDIVLAEKIQPSTAKAFYNATQVIQLAKVIAAISLGIDLTLLEIPDVTEAEGEAEVVEQTEEDIELAKIRDEAQAKVNADPLVVSALNILDDESEKNAQDIEELNIKLTKESYRLLSVADKELEPVYNLVIALLKDVSPQKIPALVNSIVDPIIANSNDRPQLKLKILSNLYNSLPFNSENRYVVYTQIVNLATKSDEFELVIPTFAYLDAWIKEWKIDISSIRNIYDLISNCLSQKSHYRESYEYLLKYLSTFETSSASELQNVQLQAIKAIKKAISVPEVLNFEPLFNSKAIQNLKTSKEVDAKNYFKLVEIFVGETLEGYENWSKGKGLKEWLIKEGLSHNDNIRKMRLLTLATLASGNIDGEVSYDTIVKELKLESNDVVEMWVIDVIRAGLIEAKMNQLKRTIVVSRATHRSFSTTQWLQLAQKLGFWKDNLEKMLDVVANAKLLADQQLQDVPEMSTAS